MPTTEAPSSDSSHVKQNPGDPRVPEGVVIEPHRRVLILNGNAALVNPAQFDEKIMLFANGHPSAEDEQAELVATGGVVDESA